MTIRTVGHTLYRALAALLTLLIVLLNTRLYLPSGASYGVERVGPDVAAQLRFIGDALGAGAGEQMQALFPEGFFFTHALYGLAWVEVGQRAGAGDPLRAQALVEARAALAQLDSPAAQSAFSPSLSPPLGVFYNGWSSWLRGGVLLLQPAGARDPSEVARFSADCAALAAAFDASASPFLSAYPGQAWPVDSTVAIAALRLHDHLFAPRFGATVARWLAAARARRDPATGLLPHRADPATGAALEGARATSQSIILRFLPEIDGDFARDQYTRFRQQFVTTRLGIPAVSEYPGGGGAGDVDSGPLIFGISASATVVTRGAALVNGDAALADALLHTMEFSGLPLEWRGAKRYAFGLLPVGDAFVVWSKTARPWTVATAPLDLAPPAAWWWRLPLTALALALVALLWLPVYAARLRSVRTRI